MLISSHFLPANLPLVGVKGVLIMPKRNVLRALALIFIFFIFTNSAYAVSLRILKEEGRVEVEGEISRDLGRYDVLKGAIEYLACAPGGKSYESLLVLKCKPSEIYQALLSLGLQPGAPASVDLSGKPTRPRGPGVTLLVEWKGKEDGEVRVRAEELIYNSKTKKPMDQVEWIFTGSRRLEDPETGHQALQADMTQNIISTHQADPSVILQNPLIEASDENLYKANEELLPNPGTQVKLIIDASRPLAYRLLISGQVQGVGFRAFAKEQAERLGVVGYVKNLPDGKVESLIEGRAAILDEMIRRLKQGSFPAEVEKVSSKKIPASGKYNGFEILY